MSIGDWLFARKKRKETLEWWESANREYEAAPLPEGKMAGNGEIICPRCGHRLSLSETLQNRRDGSMINETDCPKCNEPFKCGGG